MSGITTARSIRYATLDDPISASFLADTTTDIQRELDALDAAKLLAMKRPVAMASTFSFSVPVTTVTTIQFATEDVDTHGLINLGTNNTRITLSSQAGVGLYYCLAMSDCLNSGSWTLGELTLRKNGTAITRRKAWNGAGNTSCKLYIARVVYLGTVGDFLDLTLFHTGGATDNIGFTQFKVFKITN